MAKKELSVGLNTQTVVLTIVVLGGGYYIVNEFAKSTGIKDSKGDKDRQSLISKNYWSGAYYNEVINLLNAGKLYRGGQRVTSIVIPSSAKARFLCEKIYYAKGVFIDADADALTAFQAMPTLAYVSYICAFWDANFRSMFPAYLSVDNPSLFSYLKFLDDKSWTSLKEILSDKPSF